MSTLQDVVSKSSVNSTLAASATTSTEIQDRFLRLLITQMKNQDPLNPMDNAQITSQMSQISTVGGIEKLNTTMQSFSSSLLSSQSLQATSLIGHTVYAEGSSLAYNGSAPAGGGVDLAQSVDSLKINVIGPAGNVVRQIDLGARQAGLAAFLWDGRNDGGANAAAGAYSFQVDATSGAQKVPATSLVSGQISSVTLGRDGVHAIVNGVGDVPLRQINRIM
ncbi:MAG: flagellar biosynthesis protein FlgD [Betaproteobacteria bacterium]|nr:flagellar biosynthesis protein FlgD [Betaproteobacteria bacterium]